MDNNVSEVTLVEQDLLMSVDEFAKQEDVTPRTVYRWIELGRLETVERLGKKYVNASVPLKTGSGDNDNVGNDTKSQKVGALQQVNIFEEYMKTLRDNGKNFEKSSRRWQLLCFASIFLFFAALLAGTAVSMLFYYENEMLSDKLTSATSDLSEAESKRMATETRVDNLYETMDKNVLPYKEENAKLKSRIDNLTAQNDDLRSRLDVAMSRQATLLDQLATEKAKAAEAVAMANSLAERPDTTASPRKSGSF